MINRSTTVPDLRNAPSFTRHRPQTRACLLFPSMATFETLIFLSVRSPPFSVARSQFSFDNQKSRCWLPLLFLLGPADIFKVHDPAAWQVSIDRKSIFCRQQV